MTNICTVIGQDAKSQLVEFLEIFQVSSDMKRPDISAPFRTYLAYFGFWKISKSGTPNKLDPWSGQIRLPRYTNSPLGHILSLGSSVYKRGPLPL
jgi:hypothetical protein